MEDYKEFLKNQKDGKNFNSSIAGRINVWHLVAIGGLGLVSGIVTNWGEINNLAWWFFGAVVLVYCLTLLSKKKDNQLLSRSLMEQLVLHDARSEIGPGKIFPVGTIITPTLTFVESTIYTNEGEKVKDYFLIKIKKPNSSVKDYLARISPYDGRVMKYQEMPLGFNGSEKEVKDFLIINQEVEIKPDKR